MHKGEDINFTGGYNILMLKAEEGNLGEVHRIITELRNIDINTVNKKGYTALSLAVKSGHAPVVDLLIHAGADTNTKNNSGQSPLFLACWNNYEDLVRLLLDNGAEINEVDHRGWTPLMISAYHGHRQTVRELLSRNADKNIQDLFGKKALDRAKDSVIIKMLQSVVSGRNSSPSQQDKHHAKSTMKKSNSKASVRSTKNENTSNLLSPQSTTSTSTTTALNLLKGSPTFQSTQKRLTEPRRNSNHQQQVSSLKKSDFGSGEKTLTALRSVLSDALSPIRPATATKLMSSPTSTLERQLFRDDLESLLNDQLRTIRHKVQQIVEQKVSLEIPMQLQGFENDVKSQLESILQYKAADIFKNLQAVFNLKLKFCLTRLGYDPTSLSVNTFLEDDTDYVSETIGFTKEPTMAYNKKEFKAIENDLERLEKTIISQKSQNQSILRGSHRDCSPQGHQCDHTSQLHRMEIKNDLLDHLGGEVRSTTEYLLDYSNTRVTEIAREESGTLYKKIVTEVTRNMEALEDELKKKFESIINDKLDKITEVMGSAANGEVNYRKERQTNSATINTQSKKDTKNNFKSASPSAMRESFLSDKKEYESRTRAAESSQAKDRIQKIKNSLNFMDEENESKQARTLTSNQASRYYEENVLEEASQQEDFDYAESPVPAVEEESQQEIERIYNPAYRSSLAQEKSPQSSHSQAKNNSNKKPESKEAWMRNAKLSQPQQSRSTAESKKNTKNAPIPRHQFATNGKVEQGAVSYNFANE